MAAVLRHFISTGNDYSTDMAVLTLRKPAFRATIFPISDVSNTASSKSSTVPSVWKCFCISILFVLITLVSSSVDVDHFVCAKGIHLLRYHQAHVVIGSDTLHSNAQLLPVLQYIQYHYATVTLQELSELFHYHPTYIGKAIKEETGKTFNELRQDLRLSRAADLLRHTDTPLQQVAMDLGYSDVSHFYRNFKSRYGMTPNQYRNDPS